MRPAFADSIRVVVPHAKTGAAYVLQRADAIVPTEANLGDITRICNEPLVYDMIFASALGGSPYPRQKAESFLRWAAEGWRSSTHFVFVVTAPSGCVAAAIDVKSADLEGGAEVGYWCSAEHHGLMTNTLAALLGLADAAGYRRLFAVTRPDNARSRAVLTRNGFALAPEELPGRPGLLLFRRHR